MDEESVEYITDHAAWFAGQLDAAGWTRDDESIIRYLVDEILSMPIIQAHIGTGNFNKALELADELLRGRSLGEDHWTDLKRATDTNARAVWVQVQPGHVLNRQDRVRIKSDAYDGALGLAHNGRTGSVMGVRYGMAIVHYDDEPAGTGHHHSIRLLEKRIAQ